MGRFKITVSKLSHDKASIVNDEKECSGLDDALQLYKSFVENHPGLQVSLSRILQ